MRPAKTQQRSNHRSGAGDRRFAVGHLQCVGWGGGFWGGLAPSRGMASGRAGVAGRQPCAHVHTAWRRDNGHRGPVQGRCTAWPAQERALHARPPTPRRRTAAAPRQREPKPRGRRRGAATDPRDRAGGRRATERVGNRPTVMMDGRDRMTGGGRNRIAEDLAGQPTCVAARRGARKNQGDAMGTPNEVNPHDYAPRTRPAAVLLRPASRVVCPAACPRTCETARRGWRRH